MERKCVTAAALRTSWQKALRTSWQKALLGFSFQSRSLRSNMASAAISSIMSQSGSSRLAPT